MEFASFAVYWQTKQLPSACRWWNKCSLWFHCTRSRPTWISNCQKLSHTTTYNPRRSIFFKSPKTNNTLSIDERKVTIDKNHLIPEIFQTWMHHIWVSGETRIFYFNQSFIIFKKKKEKEYNKFKLLSLLILSFLAQLPLVPPLIKY